MSTLLTMTQAQQPAADALHAALSECMEVNHDLSRSLVSFQANKSSPIYRWFKYKEGFSSVLVSYFLDKLTTQKGVLLDPFAGVGTSLFAARELGWDAEGIELLPVGCRVMEARRSAETVSVADVAAAVRKAQVVSYESHYDINCAFSHIPITQGAFSTETERQMAGYLAWCRASVKNADVRRLFEFACFSILEEISYTRKDGQYLRWDERSSRDRLKAGFHKGKIPKFQEAIKAKLQLMLEDLSRQQAGSPLARGEKGGLTVHCGSCLDILPTMRARTADLVVTSPPYCNRYDYTRTYALELAFLGHTRSQVSDLRQAMLSCTVENREKVTSMRSMYEMAGKLSVFRTVERVFSEQAALQEALALLEDCRQEGKLNNVNVPRMVRNYFYEMCFVVFELARILKPGGHVVMVNDNVRYAGVEMPVDLILSDFARKFGLRVQYIWVLPRGKGNSSQQMGSYGRREIRKCVYVWEKPRN